jgi:hypothetical protein
VDPVLDVARHCCVANHDQQLPTARATAITHTRHEGSVIYRSHRQVTFLGQSTIHSVYL